MKAEDRTFLDVAVKRGVLTIERRTRAEVLIAEVERLNQPLTARDVLEIKGLLSADEIALVDAAIKEKDTPALGAGKDAAVAAATEPVFAEATQKVARSPGAPAGKAKTAAVDSDSDAPRLAGFEIARKLGRSVVGPIYLAKQRKDKRLATVKVIGARFLADPAAREALLEMGRNLASVDGKHVLEVLDCGGLDDGGAYVAAAAVEGLSVQTRLRGSLPQREILRLAVGIAKGLGELHAKGVAHGAIRPHNIFLEHGRRVRVAGHELACLLRAASIRAPLPKHAQAYAAPELSPGRASRRGDVFALGVLLYEAFADKLPGHEPVRLVEVLASVDRRVDALVMGCLSPEPVRRPNATELIGLLEKLAGDAAAKAAS